jgi:hypothetical protein
VHLLLHICAAGDELLHLSGVVVPDRLDELHPLAPRGRRRECLGRLQSCGAAGSRHQATALCCGGQAGHTPAQRRTPAAHAPLARSGRCRAEERWAGEKGFAGQVSRQSV